MSTQRYWVTPHPIETPLTWVKSGEIAIPEIRRPFVWNAAKVHNLLDSFYHGYPVGYLIAWLQPNGEAQGRFEILGQTHPHHYDGFLAERRHLMSLKIKAWFEVLS